MIKEKAMELVKALRSGDYTQIEGRLKTDEGFCCLGVMCDLDQNSNEWNKRHPDQRYYTYLNCSVGLPMDTMSFFGMKTNDGSLPNHLPIKIGDISYSSLAEANDKGCTFNQIADYIETNWEKL